MHYAQLYVITWCNLTDTVTIWTNVNKTETMREQWSFNSGRVSSNVMRSSISVVLCTHTLTCLHSFCLLNLLLPLLFCKYACYPALTSVVLYIWVLTCNYVCCFVNMRVTLHLVCCFVYINANLQLRSCFVNMSVNLHLPLLFCKSVN
jgi:hypothetical protein